MPTGYQQFWSHYLAEHVAPATRATHVAGTSIALLLIAGGLITGRWWLVPAGVAVGYGLAWASHLAVERNRPATFSHPLWSLASDVRMFVLFWTGRLGRELRRHGLN